MGGMNATLFIDGLPILLMAVILAVPLPMHHSSVDLPITHQNTAPIEPQDPMLWNARTVSSDELEATIAAPNAPEDEPLLRFDPAALASDDTARTFSLTYVGNQHRLGRQCAASRAGLFEQAR